MNYSRMEIDELSEEIIRQFFNRYNTNFERVDIELFVTDYLKIPLVYETFAEEERDRLGFTSNGKRPLKVVRGTKQVELIFPAQTIVIDSYLKNHSENGKRRFTIAHEAAHRSSGMSIRTILYGYKVVNGKNTILDYEAAVVNEIFTDYINGKSLKAIASKLTEKEIAYHLDKTVWSKNLVSRIIANPKYIGEDGYPAIISQSVFDLANKRKSMMGGTQIDVPYNVAKIKSRTVCGKCGHNIGRHSEWLSHDIKWECPKGCRFDTYLNDTEVFDSLLNILNDVTKVPELLLIHSERFE